jgi:MoxR-like ATPase
MNTIAMYSTDPADKNPDPARLAHADNAPPWRKYARKPTDGLLPRVARHMDEDQAVKGQNYCGKPHECDLVNAALFLRRPLLITGNAGVGKSTLAYAVAYQLGLGNVLRWGITSRSTLKDALYHYDAIARLHEASAVQGSSEFRSEEIGKFITLGPLGTALLPTRTDGYFPRVLLVDEIDKSDADLPSDLLHVLEEGCFHIPELVRMGKSQADESVTVRTSDRGMPEEKIPCDGWVRCDDFPFIVMTSNGERDFPPAFLRRCLRLDIKRQDEDLLRIIEAHLGNAAFTDEVQNLIKDFCERDKNAALATDQLLNAIFLQRSRFDLIDATDLKNAIFRSLNE